MDEGVERIRRLARAAASRGSDGSHEAEAEEEARRANQSALAQLEAAIPSRLRQLAEAADGSLQVEDTAFRSSSATAMQITWRPGTTASHQVELWLLKESGSVEWRWRMGHRQPPIVRRVPATRFNLARLDEIVAALAEPEQWHDGHAPEV